jgi:hypothetical protein
MQIIARTKLLAACGFAVLMLCPSPGLLAGEQDDVGDYRPRGSAPKAPMLRPGLGGSLFLRPEYQRRTNPQTPAPARKKQRQTPQPIAQPRKVPTAQQPKSNRTSSEFAPADLSPTAAHPRPASTKRRHRPTPPLRYSRAVRKAIRHFNRYGQKHGDIQLFAREGAWGPAVKIQRCFGDNISSYFEMVNKGEAGRVWFQYQNVTSRNRRHHRWVMVDPLMRILGQHIFLRAQSSKGSDIITIKVRGNCISEESGQVGEYEK